MCSVACADAGVTGHSPLASTLPSALTGQAVQQLIEPGLAERAAAAERLSRHAQWAATRPDRAHAKLPLFGVRIGNPERHGVATGRILADQLGRKLCRRLSGHPTKLTPRRRLYVAVTSHPAREITLAVIVKCQIKSAPHTAAGIRDPPIDTAVPIPGREFDQHHVLRIMIVARRKSFECATGTFGGTT